MHLFGLFQINLRVSILIKLAVMLMPLVCGLVYSVLFELFLPLLSLQGLCLG